MKLSEDLDYQKFLAALLEGDRLTCSDIAIDFLDSGHTINQLYEEMLKRALYEVGERWEQGKISVATEHLASAIVESLLNRLYFSIISDTKINKTVVVSCVENEFHQIGIKMVSDVFEMHGWNAYFLGANTPTKELVEFIKTINPTILALSLSLYFHLPELESMIKTIRKEFPDLLIMVGGQAFRHGGKDVINKYDHVILGDNLNNLESFLKNSAKNG